MEYLVGLVVVVLVVGGLVWKYKPEYVEWVKSKVNKKVSKRRKK